MSILLLIEYSLEVASGKGYCKDLGKDYYRIADVTTSFLLIIMLFVISFNLLFGVVKKRERLLIPFLALQVMDFLLSLLTMFSSYIQVPATVPVSSLRHTKEHLKTPFLALQLLDFCLSILTLCSSYMEVPTYLSLKSADNRGFMPALEKLPTEEYAKVMVTFTVAFIAVLFLKKMPAVFEVQPYANKNKRHMTSPQCTAQGKYLFHMVCFTGLAYFLAPQSVNRSPFLRKSLFTTLCNATRREAGLSEKQSEWKHEVFLNEPSFEVSPGQQGGLGSLGDGCCAHPCVSETPRLSSLLRRITRKLMLSFPAW
ncbi:lysosomal-associated transmembrane protein 5 isoform X2 [Lagopus leucura]|nr:lysosomal-associated transmembrane protein 5 isoform X2 [Lagopus leucura]